jgi:hypothetical protein
VEDFDGGGYPLAVFCRALLSISLFLGLASVAWADESKEVTGEPKGELRGQIFERGASVLLPNVRVVTSAGEEVSTDAEGRFVLRLPPGPVTLLLEEEAHEPLKVSEVIVAGQGLSVEYRLLSKPSYKRRYHSIVRGEARHEGERFTLRDEELHQAPGTLGDPFRVVGLLPGVATPLPILPLYVIRGASPGMNGFFLDGMRVPQLFHFLVGGGVVHAGLVDRLDFYPGVYDVSFGRYAGGVIDSETHPARSDGHHGEVELRLYDASALAELKLPHDVHLEISGHYGYPSYLIKAFDDRAGLQYWDFQLRLDWKGLTVEALGSFDDLTFALNQITDGVSKRVDDRFRLAFYRLQVRDRERLGRVDLEMALVGGVDELASFGGLGVRKLSLNGRINVGARFRRVRLQAGADVEVSRFRAQNFARDVNFSEPDEAGDLGGNRDGVVAGAYAEGTFELLPKRIFATLGARVDVYHAGPVTLLGIDPRFSYRVKLLPELSLTGGVGLYQQPPSFPIGLPGIDTFALQLGLQRAIQGASGLEASLPQGFTFSLTGFYERFSNINDVVLDIGAVVCTSPPPESLTGIAAQVLRQVEGSSYGMEVLLRRKIGRVTGWIAYTLSRSERLYSCGLRPSDYDQSHVLNFVLQVRLPWRLVAGARLYFASGRPTTLIDPATGLSQTRNNARLPDYVQLDLRLDREWIFQRWALAAFLEIVNSTYSENVFNVTYPTEGGLVRYDKPELNAFHWILPSIGVRGRF